MHRNLHEDLAEQLHFLKASCWGYDQGTEIEAKRLAVTIRVLVHDTAASHSLLGQLAVKETLEWLDTAGPIDPTNLMPTMGLASVILESHADGSSLFSYAPHDSAYAQQVYGAAVPFEFWWTEPVVKDSSNNEFSRKELVLALANKDGGAHIDILNGKLRQLAHQGSLGWSFTALPVVESEGESNPALPELMTITPILASVRTIAEEVLATIRAQPAILGWPTPPQA